MLIELFFDIDSLSAPDFTSQNNNNKKKKNEKNEKKIRF